MSLAAPRIITTLSVLSLTAALGCSDRGGHEIVVEGNDAVNVSIPDTATDGWTIDFTRFVVVLHDPGLIERIDRKPAWVREYGVTVWDVLSPNEDMGVLSRVIRASEFYDGVDFRIAPSSVSAYEPIAGNVDSDVVDEAVERDYAIRVVGTATGPMGESVGFDWEFTTDTRYRCDLGADDKVVIAADGSEVTVIEILGDMLFAQDGGSLAFQPIADADADADETVTIEELGDAGLLDGIEALTRSIGSVRDAPACDSFPGDESE